jgi:hypothetical protein
VREQRKSKRYELKLPLQLLRAGRQSRAEECETRNLSSGGVLFDTKLTLEIGEPIEYRITLPGQSPSEPAVLLHCKGKVLRTEPANGSGFQHIAATLERYEFVRARETHSAKAEN